jgi:hypothetical protein
VIQRGGAAGTVEIVLLGQGGKTIGMRGNMRTAKSLTLLPPTSRAMPPRESHAFVPLKPNEFTPRVGASCAAMVAATPREDESGRTELDVACRSGDSAESAQKASARVV